MLGGGCFRSGEPEREKEEEEGDPRKDRERDMGKGKGDFLPAAKPSSLREEGVVVAVGVWGGTSLK